MIRCERSDSACYEEFEAGAPDTFAVVVNGRTYNLCCHQCLDWELHYSQTLGYDKHGILQRVVPASQHQVLVEYRKRMEQ